jgi:hypothetical protein
MKLAMCFEKPNVEKKRLLGFLFEEPNSGWSDLPHVRSAGCDNLVVPYDSRVLGNMLHAYKRRSVSMRPKRMQNVLFVIVQRETAMGESQHAVVMGTMPGQKGGTARRTSGCGVERLPEQNPFPREFPQIRSGNFEPVRLDVPSGVV